MTIKGVLLSFCANFSFQTMNILIKVASLYTNITSIHLLYLRSMFNVLLISSASQIASKSIFQIHKDDSSSLLLRVICGVITNTINFVSIYLINISVFTSLRMIAPAITAMLAYFILHESLSVYDLVSMAISYLGVMIIINPFGIQDFTATSRLLLPIFSCFTGALGATLLRKINKRSNFFVCPFFFSIGQIIISPLLVGWNEHIFSFNWVSFWMILAITLCGFIGQLLNSMAMTYEKAGRISMISYMSLVYAFLSDIFIFKADIRACEVIGSLLIVGSSITITILKGKNAIE